MSAADEAALDRLRRFHEAGHAVIARRLGFTLIEVAADGVRTAAPRRAVALADGTPLGYAEARALVALAGHAAARRAVAGLSHGPGPADLREASAALDVLHTTTEGLDHHRAALGRLASRLLAQPDIWDEVEAVAAALTLQDVLTGAEVRALIEAGTALGRTVGAGASRLCRRVPPPTMRGAPGRAGRASGEAAVDEFLVIPDQQDGVHDVALSEEQVAKIAGQLGLSLTDFMKAYEGGTITVERFTDTSTTPHQIVVTFSDEDKAVPVRFKPHLTS